MILGNDISAWQRANPRTNGDVSFQKMRAAGSRFCFFRAQFGMLQDVDFNDYWRDSKAAGLPRGAYYFPITNYEIEAQTQKFIDIIKADPGELPPVIDVERYQGTVPKGFDIKKACMMIEAKLNVRPIIYTGYYMWKDDVTGSNDKFFAGYGLWIAHYGVAKPMVPPPWTDWVIWQMGEGKGKGLEFGVESLDIDMDSFNGTEAEFALYTGTKPIDPTPTTGEFILTASQEMNVRTGPSIRSPRIATIPAGSTVMPTAVSGFDAWVKIADGKWVCAQQGDTQYLV